MIFLAPPEARRAWAELPVKWIVTQAGAKTVPTVCLDGPILVFPDARIERVRDLQGRLLQAGARMHRAYGEFARTRSAAARADFAETRRVLRTGWRQVVKLAVGFAFPHRCECLWWRGHFMMVEFEDPYLTTNENQR